MSLRFVLIAEGNAETSDCWSGSAHGFVQAVRRMGHSVQCVNVEPRGWRRYLLAARTWRQEREAWRQQFLMSDAAFAARSAEAMKAARTLNEADVVVQIGATFCLPSLPHRVARVIYADANAALGRVAASFSEVGKLSEEEFRRMKERERALYSAADRIWACSTFLAQSFARDFEVPPSRLKTVYVGANLQSLVSGLADRPWPRAPRILFIGRQHRRKGLDVLLAAFQILREVIPAASLDIVGPPLGLASLPGATVHGPLSASRPDQAALIRQLYSEASVFCMPSRFEPFGVVFTEAMLAGLPCIGTDRWAMPEIIVDGETGLVVPDGDAPALAAALERLLRDPKRAETMGAAGHRRACDMFIWDAVAARAVRDAEELVMHRRSMV